MFHHYRRLIALRLAHPVLSRGRSKELLPDHAQLSAVLREWQTERWLVVCNWSDHGHMARLPAEWERHGAELLLGNLAHRRGSADERQPAGTPCRVDLQALWCQPWEGLILRLL